MWFVSRRRYDELLREKDGLQERLFRTNTATRKSELERNQAKANEQSLGAQLDAALLDISKLTNERDQAKANAQNLSTQLEAALLEIGKTAQDRDALLAKLRTIRDHLCQLPGDPSGNGAEPHILELVKGVGAADCSERKGHD